MHVHGTGQGDGAAALYVDLLGADYFGTNRCNERRIEIGYFRPVFGDQRAKLFPKGNGF